MANIIYQNPFPPSQDAHFSNKSQHQGQARHACSVPLSLPRRGRPRNKVRHPNRGTTERIIIMERKKKSVDREWNKRPLTATSLLHLIGISYKGLIVSSVWVVCPRSVCLHWFGWLFTSIYLFVYTSLIVCLHRCGYLFTSVEMFVRE